MASLPLPFRVALSLALLLVALGSSAGAQLPVARTNGNRVPAGRDSAGILVLDLTVAPAAWHLDGDDDPAIELLAFAEPGRPPQVPGPLLRVVQGTPVLVRVQNPLVHDTLVLHGLAGRASVSRDSVTVLPGRTVTVRFVADSVGTFLYWASTTGATLFTRRGADSQLHGAFVVDPVGGARPDRVLVLSWYVDSMSPEGNPEREFLAINGKSWPSTERFTYALGDTIRWRVVNASGGPHPMHLHGAYFRVDAKGDWTRDTAYAGADLHMSVTERLRAGQTMQIAWSAPHPGTWLFHCHLTYHVMPHPPTVKSAVMSVSHHDENPDHHVEQGMAGLMVATTVSAPADYRVRDTARRKLRLFVLSDSLAGQPRRFSYVLERGRTPRADSVQTPGPTLVLHRDEPTAIEVVNRTGEPTAVHWHGIELDSYFDGVVGLGGLPGRQTTAIRDGGSFVARMTPPRAGSFMYHTHLDDIAQQAGGLYGPLVVLEPGERWDPVHDIVLMAGTTRDELGVLLNGLAEPPPLELRRGATYRFRLFNITLAQPHLGFALLDGETPLTWQVIAKDGWSWSPEQVKPGPARQLVSIGQTLDVRFTPDDAGEFTLRLYATIGNAGTFVTRKVIVR